MSNATTVRKKYDPYQAVDLAENTSSIDARRAAVLGTTNPFSGAIWYSKEKISPNQLTLQAGTTGTPLFRECAPSTMLTEQATSLSSIYAAPVLVPKQVYSEVPRFISLQKWEGSVLEIGEESFTARLIDLTQEGVDEEAEFSKEEVAESDLPLFKPGAIFYWNIGYEDSLTGQRTRVSMMRFRRLPVWSKEELRAAKREAIRLRESIGWK
jgi:hypothetical protein